jgi:hypothetical protein
MANSQENINDIYHLIYASTAVERLSQSALIVFLRSIRAKNEAHGVTGMLIYRDGTYLQFLEGQRREITELLTRLEKDPRHQSIRILREGMLPERLFPEWSMAFKNLAGLRSVNVPGYSELLQGHHMNNGMRGPAEMLVEMFQDVLVRG